MDSVDGQYRLVSTDGEAMHFVREHDNEQGVRVRHLTKATFARTIRTDYEFFNCLRPIPTSPISYRATLDGLLTFPQKGRHTSDSTTTCRRSPLSIFDSVANSCFARA